MVVSDEKLATKCGKHLKAIEKAKSQPARQGSEEKWLHCATQILPCMEAALAYERCHKSMMSTGTYQGASSCEKYTTAMKQCVEGTGHPVPF
mmetsp:Transcript_9488/g.19651  ORF Transcript_9488/g.19651 Transcript_9488/m.19651 type:complete len:92 (+) Transcript_9488:80-355(+)